MDQFIPGLAAAVQQALQTELPAGFARIIVGDDNFLIFAARRLGHTVGAYNAENVELLIQFANVRAVVVGHHDIPMTVQECVMEPLVIFLWEGYLIAFGLKVRRVTVCYDVADKSEFIKENIDETIFMFALFKCRKSDKGRN